MKNCSPEKLALLATEIAIELSRGKDITEINVIKSVANQICCVLQTIISERINQKLEDNKE